MNREQGREAGCGGQPDSSNELDHDISIEPLQIVLLQS
jgi:hypothetical protein